MKVVCINNELPISKTNRKSLTIGKIYEVLDSDILVEFDTGHYEIKNDFNDNKNYNNVINHSVIIVHHSRGEVRHHKSFSVMQR